MLAAALIVALSVTPTQSDSVDSAESAKVERLFAEGATLYRDGKYAAAIERFEEAYAMYEEPNLLYNIGRSYEALGRTEEALDAFERCAAHPEVGDATKKKAKAKAKNLRAAIAASKKVKVEAPEPTSPASPAPSPAAAAAPTSDAPSPAAAGEEPSGGLPLFLIGGASVAGIGAVVAIVGGVVFTLGALAHSQVEGAIAGANGDVVPMTQVEAQRLNQEGEQFKTIGLLTAAGAAAVVVVGAAVIPLEFVLGGE